MTSLRTAIALCTYNGGRFLQRQLDSLLAQTRLPDQMVIRDDVSSDGTWEVLERFAQRARGLGIEVDLLCNPVNIGYVRNFEQALRASRADVVFLCDQDDVWHAEKIERMTVEFERRPGLGLLHTDADLVDEQGQSLGLGLFETLEVSAQELADERQGNAFDVLLRRNLVTGATVALRTDLLPLVLPIPEGWVHDEWLAIATSIQSSVDYLDWTSIGYRQHGANEIGVRRRGLGEKLRRSGIPKRRFLADVVERLELAKPHMEGAGLSGSQRFQIQDRIAHARFRAELPRGLVARWRLVAAEAKGQRYWRYSSGWRSIVSDLLDLG